MNSDAHRGLERGSWINPVSRVVVEPGFLRPVAGCFCLFSFSIELLAVAAFWMGGGRAIFSFVFSFGLVFSSVCWLGVQDDLWSLKVTGVRLY